MAVFSNNGTSIIKYMWCNNVSFLTNYKSINMIIIHNVGHHNICCDHQSFVFVQLWIHGFLVWLCSAEWSRVQLTECISVSKNLHDDVIKWKHFPRYWPFVRGIHRSPLNSPHKGQWRGALMFSLICVWINGWVNNGEAGDLRRYSAHYDVIVRLYKIYFIVL